MWVEHHTSLLPYGYSGPLRAAILETCSDDAYTWVEPGHAIRGVLSARGALRRALGGLQAMDLTSPGRQSRCFTGTFGRGGPRLCQTVGWPRPQRA